MPAESPRSYDWADIGLAAAAALAVAIALYLLAVPGGLVVGGTLGGGAVALLRNREIRLPQLVRNAIQIMVGVMVGTRVTPDMVADLPRYIGPAAVATVALVGGGVLFARALHRHATMPPWIIMATCPGALEALVAVAVERREGAVEVSLFHLIRIILVVLSVPLLLLLV